MANKPVLTHRRLAYQDGASFYCADTHALIGGFNTPGQPKVVQNDRDMAGAALARQMFEAQFGKWYQLDEVGA